MQILPATIQPYAKAWVSLLGVVIAAVVTAAPDVPRWVTVIGAVLAAVGVFLTPNSASTTTAAEGAATEGGHVQAQDGPDYDPRHAEQ